MSGVVYQSLAPIPVPKQFVENRDPNKIIAEGKTTVENK
jgi:hypothetical protein